MSVPVFLRDCFKFVLYTAKLIGIVTPQFRQHNITHDATTTTLKRDSNRDPLPDATTTTTTPDNRQLLCDWWRCNRIPRWRIYAKTLLCLLLYPLAMFFVKRCTTDNTNATNSDSYFNLFAFITVYFHYALLLVVVAAKVVVEPHESFTDILTQLQSLIQSICESLNSSPFRDLPELCCEKSYAATEKSQPWKRRRSMDLGLECGLLGLAFVLLCWLSINLPLLNADNWITILCPSFILILPTIILLLFGNLFFGLSRILECVLATLNHWLRMHGMQRLSKGGNQLRQLSVCDNVDTIAQYYSRTLRLLKQLNRFHAVPILVIILNCFFTIAVQSFAIYMTFSAADDENRQQQATINSISMQNDNNRSGGGGGGGGGDGGYGFGPVGSGIEWSAIGQQQEEDGGASKESPQTVPHLYIVAVNSVYILINYLELCALIRASTCHRTLVSICAWPMNKFLGLGEYRGGDRRIVVAKSYFNHTLVIRRPSIVRVLPSPFTTL